MPKPLADAQIAELEKQVEQATEFVAISLDNARALLAEVRAARQEWAYVDSGVMPKQYDSAQIAHTDTRDGSPTVEEAQWDGERWCLARTNPCDELIYLKEQVYAWRPLPSAPPEEN